MKKRSYKRCYVVFVCLCCVADLGAAASSKGYNVAGEVALDGGMVCLSQKPLFDCDTLAPESVSGLDLEGNHQRYEYRLDAGPCVEKCIAKVCGACSRKKDMTIVYKETLTAKTHQFCFNVKDQLVHYLAVPSENNAVVRCRLYTWGYVYQCALQGVYKNSDFAYGYGVLRFVSDQMESILQDMSGRLEAVMKDSSSDRREKARELWCYKNFWLKSDDQKRVWNLVDPAAEFPNNCVRVTVGYLTLEGMFVEKQRVPPKPPKDSMRSVMWADFCKENTTKKRPLNHMSEALR